MTDDILYLESDAEINLIVDKIKTLKGESVALVIPRDAQILSSVVNLQILKKQAKKLKKAIAIVTTDPAGTLLANKVGIPVYRSTSDDEPIDATKRISNEPDEVIQLNATPTTDDGEITDASHLKIQHYGEDQHNKMRQELTSAPGEFMTHEIDEKAQPPSSDATGKTQHRFSKGLFVKLGVFLLLLGAAVWWFLIFLPSATVFLSLRSEPITKTTTVAVDNNINKIDEATSRIPGQKLEVEFTKKQSFKATGEKEVGTKAKGLVTVSNRLGEPVTLEAGTTLTRDSLEFATLTAVTVPKADATVDAVGAVKLTPGTATVEVEAKQAGDSHNLKPGDFVISSLSGIKREKVTASNSTAFAGGESSKVTVISQEDLDKAKETIAKDSIEEALTKLRDISRGLQIVSGTQEVSVTEATPTKQVGEEVTEFELDTKLKATVIGFDGSVYQAMVISLVGKDLDQSKELAVAAKDSIETSISSKDYNQGLLHLQATLTSEIVARINQEELKAKVAGQSAVSAEKIILEQAGIASVTIALQPSFRSHLPKRSSQIEIIIKR